MEIHIPEEMTEVTMSTIESSEDKKPKTSNSVEKELTNIPENVLESSELESSELSAERKDELFSCRNNELTVTVNETVTETDSVIQDSSIETKNSLYLSSVDSMQESTCDNSFKSNGDDSDVSNITNQASSNSKLPPEKPSTSKSFATPEIPSTSENLTHELFVERTSTTTVLTTSTPKSVNSSAKLNFQTPSSEKVTEEAAPRKGIMKNINLSKYLQNAFKATDSRHVTFSNVGLSCPPSDSKSTSEIDEENKTDEEKLKNQSTNTITNRITSAVASVMQFAFHSFPTVVSDTWEASALTHEDKSINTFGPRPRPPMPSHVKRLAMKRKNAELSESSDSVNKIKKTKDNHSEGTTSNEGNKPSKNNTL